MNVPDIRKILKHQISENPVMWEPSCSMRTDITNVTDAIRYLANTPKNDQGNVDFNFRHAAIQHDYFQPIYSPVYSMTVPNQSITLCIA